jgi:sugar phosphate isomerase/epimerase
MNRLAMNIVGDELEQAAEYCRKEGIGLEVSEFAYPTNLEGDLSAQIDRHLKALQGLDLVGSHGPFLDLIATSPDPAIVEVCRKRHQVSLHASSVIGASLYVVHTNYNPLIKNPSYRDHFTRRMLDFWLPLADWAGQHGLIICLENMWESGPETQADIITKANHPHLKASFDNGHALVFSQIPAKDWIEQFGSGLFHCHLHDNLGEIDEHEPVGEGKEIWSELLHAVQKWSPEAVLVAESDQFEKNKKSIKRLKNFT